MNAVEIKIPAELGALYALSDAERFPASQLAEGLERESTLFWADFSVADRFGIKAIRETFANAHFETRGYKVVTELAVVLNHKIWEWYEKAENANDERKRKVCEFVQALYNGYYDQVCAWVNDNLKGDEATFFWRVMD